MALTRSRLSLMVMAVGELEDVAVPFALGFEL